MRGIPSAEKFDRRLRRLRRIEAGYRAEIRRAKHAMEAETFDRTKAEKRYHRLRAKLEGKIERLQPKIKELTNLKAGRRG